MIRAIQAVGDWVGGLIVRMLRSIGIRFEIAKRPPTNCDEPPRPPGCGANPLICGSSQAFTYSVTGGAAEYVACGAGPHTLMRATGTFVGLDAAARAELRFAPAPIVTVRVVRFANPARVEAFGSGGGLVGMQMMSAPPGVEQQFTFSGAGIDRIVVTPAAPNDGTLVLGWCH